MFATTAQHSHPVKPVALRLGSRNRNESRASVELNVAILLLCISAAWSSNTSVSGSEPATDAERHCGPACLAVALRNLGVDEAKIEATVQKLDEIADRRHGLTSLLEIRDAARTADVTAVGVKCNTAALASIASDAQAILNATGNLHFGLVEDWGERDVQLYVPGLNTEHPRWRVDRFIGTWNNIALLIGQEPLPTLEQGGKFQLVDDETLATVLGGDYCANVTGTGHTAMLPTGSRKAITSGSGAPASDDTLSADPVVIRTGNLALTADDLTIPARGMPLQLTRSYNSQIVSEVPGWTPEPGAGSWAVESGEYSGHGNRTLSDVELRDIIVEADVRTVHPKGVHGETHETAWIHVRYTESPKNRRFVGNSYYVLIHTDGTVELCKFKNGIQYVEQHATRVFPYKVPHENRSEEDTSNSNRSYR